MGLCLFALGFEVLTNRVEYAVYELRSFQTGETTRGLESFVNSDGVWSIAIKELKNRKPQYVAVDDRHSLDPPVLGTRSDLVVYWGYVFEGAEDELVGEVARLVVDRLVAELFPVSGGQCVARVVCHVGGEEHLQRALARLVPCTALFLVFKRHWEL